MYNGGGRAALNAMAGTGNGSRNGKRVITPAGFGVVSTVFGLMRKYYPGTWFVGVHKQADLRERALVWQVRLAEFPADVVLDVVRAYVEGGDFNAPSLDAVAVLCAEQVAPVVVSDDDRAAAVDARNRALRMVSE